MALIDATYFTGELSIPNTDKDYVLARLNQFIELRQDEFLRRALGYAMYKAFIAGIAEVSIPTRWQNVLTGADFTNIYSQKLQAWPGLIQVAGGLTFPLTQAGTLDIVVDRGGAYDPIAGLDIVTIPPAFRGVPLIIEQRGYGQLRPDEFEITTTTEANDTLHLLAWTFEADDTYFYKTVASIGAALAGDVIAKSPIASYVYYYWMKDSVSITTGVGEANMQAENASRQSHAYKMVRAWNEMAKDMCVLRDFFESNKTTYPEWDYAPYFYQQDGASMIDYLARPINLMGI